MPTPTNRRIHSATPKTEPDHPPLLVTIPQAAALLSVSRSTIYELIWRHALDPVKIGRSVRLRVSDLEAFTEHGEAAGCVPEHESGPVTPAVTPSAVITVPR